MQVVEPWKDLPNFLSGGADSGTILAAQLALEAKPPVYLLQLGNTQSSDFLVARQMAEAFGLTYRSAIIPRDEETLVHDIREMYRVLGTTRKTAIQCGQCMKYLAQTAAADGHTEALTGTGGVVEDCRACAVILHQQGEEAAREYRRQSLFGSTSTEMNGTRAMHDASRHFGIVLREPYSQQPLADYIIELDMAEINRPVQKGIALRAFPEFWRAGSWYRHNKSMQVGAGVRSWHDTLLASRYNRRGSKRIIGVYNDLVKGEAT